MTLEQFIDDAIAKSMAPSKKFPGFLPEVDDKKLGALLATYRKKKNVQAKDVGKMLGKSKIQIYFLEKGEKHWDLELLQKYLKAVKRLTGRPKKLNSKKADSENGRPS